MVIGNGSRNPEHAIDIPRPSRRVRFSFSRGRLIGLPLLVALFTALVTPSVNAGGGPENLVLVVNAESDSSKLVANHYIQLRNIPPSHVIYLTGIADVESISDKDFREKILQPIFRVIAQRQINKSIDYIVYSTGFPTKVGVNSYQKLLFEKFAEQGNPIPQKSQVVFRPVASINSMTYFASAVMRNDPSFLLLDSNWYYRAPTKFLLERPFLGSAQESYESAISQLQGGDIDEGISELKKLATAHPGQVAVSYSLARAYARKSNGLEAANWLTRSIRAGWAYRDFTRSDLAFESILDSEPLKSALDQIPDQDFKYLPTTGFSSTKVWGPNGFPNRDREQGKSFLLSTVLASTRNMGISEQDVIEYLKTSVASDSQRPNGVVFFSDNGDVRAKTRKPGFAETVEALKKMNIDTLIDKQQVPQKLKIAGAILGRAGIPWEGSGSKISPGSIVENLTSWGGVMDGQAHTKCTEFLKWGAAGSSGTVTEPLAIQAKFPHPMIQAHYARGCSLAEAFYQSVHGPFQLLIVGDALCQPYANRPSFKVTGVRPRQVVSAAPVARIEYGSDIPVSHIEVYLDGVLLSRKSAVTELPIDTTKFSDGYHELTLVAVAADPIATSARQSFPIFVKNEERRIDISASEKAFDFDQDVEVSFKSNFGNRVEVVQNGRVVAESDDRSGSLTIPASLLGRGPVNLMAVAYDSATPEYRVQSVPVQLEVVGAISSKVPITSRNLRKQLEGKTER